MQIFRFLSQNQDKIVLIIGAILVCAIGFAGGRLTAVRHQPEPITIEEPEENLVEESEIKGEVLETVGQTKEDKGSEEEIEAEKEDSGDAAKTEGKYVGSKNSKKYHYPDCRYGKRIKEENKIWFSSAKQAQEAGYVPCKVCKPPASD